MGKKGPHTAWWKMPTGSTTRIFFRKWGIELPSAPAIPLRGIYPQDSKSVFRKDICFPMLSIPNSPSLEKKTTSVVQEYITGQRNCGIDNTM